MKIFARKRRLHNPLGDWLYAHEDLNCDWIYYYDARKNILYQRQNNIVYKHARSEDGWRRHKGLQTSKDVLPKNVVPVAVQVNLNSIQVTNWLKPYKSLLNGEPITNVDILNFDTIPPWEQQLLHNVEFLATPQEVYDCIKNGKVITMSDGG